MRAVHTSNVAPAMFRSSTVYIAVLLGAVLLLAPTGCHLIARFEPADAPTQPCFLCEAEIYREVGDRGLDEFTELWRLYAWPNDEDRDQDVDGNDANLYCTARLQDYIRRAMAPGFAWRTRGFQVRPAPTKRVAGDCVGSDPPAYGAPLGAEVNWNVPLATQASVWVRLQDRDGNFHEATPQVAQATLQFAERTGLPDIATGVYERSVRHLRFSDVFINLQPFDLANIRVESFYIQSIGTVVAEHAGGLDYRVHIGNAKFYVGAFGRSEGESGGSSFCFLNGLAESVRVYQGPPNPSLAFAFQAIQIGGQPLDVRISLSSPSSQRFGRHQPFVQLVDKRASGPRVRLEADITHDHDGDFNYYLWFENFEAGNERFLGAGTIPITDVPFTPGQHEVTVVAYDRGGAYNTDTMTLTVTDSNDACFDAVSIPQPLPASFAGSTLRATVDAVPTCQSISGEAIASTAPGVWYSVVGTGQVMTASVCNGDTAHLDPKLSVFCGGCNGLRCITAEDDTAGCGLRPEVSWCASPGTLYHILVHGFNQARGDFRLDVSGDEPCIFSLACPERLVVMDGLGSSPDTFISPRGERCGFSRFRLAGSEPLTLDSVTSVYTAPESAPTVTLLSQGGGQHSVLLSKPLVPGHWLKLSLRVTGQRTGRTTTHSVWVAHQPLDFTQDGTTNIRDATAFGDEFRGRRAPDLTDIDCNGQIDIRDATAYGSNWNGLPPATRAWRNTSLPARP